LSSSSQKRSAKAGGDAYAEYTEVVSLGLGRVLERLRYVLPIVLSYFFTFLEFALECTHTKTLTIRFVLQVLCLQICQSCCVVAAFFWV
jgi:hypothetical protein